MGRGHHDDVKELEDESLAILNGLEELRVVSCKLRSD
jgi:hypothetical protein